MYMAFAMCFHPAIQIAGLFYEDTIWICVFSGFHLSYRTCTFPLSALHCCSETYLCYHENYLASQKFWSYSEEKVNSQDVTCQRRLSPAWILQPQISVQKGKRNSVLWGTECFVWLMLLEPLGEFHVQGSGNQLMLF